MDQNFDQFSPPGQLAVPDEVLNLSVVIAKLDAKQHSGLHVLMVELRSRDLS